MTLLQRSQRYMHPLVAGLLLDVVCPSWTIAVGVMVVFLAWMHAVIVLGTRRAFAPTGERVARLHHHRHKR